MAFDQGSTTYRLLNKLDGKATMYKSIGKDDLVVGRCICSRCENTVREFYYIKEDTARIHCALCIKCALELNPPKWQLIIATINNPIDNSIEPIGNYDIWDETHKRKETTATLKELVECGWFIRRVVETVQKVPRRIIKKIDLEYHGKLTCLRFRYHYKKLGLGHLAKCKSPFCEFIYENMQSSFKQPSCQEHQNYW